MMSMSDSMRSLGADSSAWSFLMPLWESNLCMILFVGLTRQSLLTSANAYSAVSVLIWGLPCRHTYRLMADLDESMWTTNGKLWGSWALEQQLFGNSIWRAVCLICLKSAFIVYSEGEDLLNGCTNGWVLRSIGRLGSVRCRRRCNHCLTII